MSERRIFILEDDEYRIQEFIKVLGTAQLTICKTLGGSAGAYKRFTPPYDYICLDHDLGDRQYVPSEEEETGFQFVRFMGAAPDPIISDPLVFVHSYNPDGAVAMCRLLRENKWNVMREPFGPKLLSFVKANL